MSTLKSGIARILVEKLSWTPHLHAVVKVGRDVRWSGIINNSDVSVLISHGWNRQPAAARLALDAAMQDRTIRRDEIIVDEYRQPIVVPTTKRKAR